MSSSARIGIGKLGVALLVLGAVANGCADRTPTASTDGPIARVGTETVSLAELEWYLSLNLLDGDEGNGAEPAELDLVKSRLLDTLVEEKIFLVEARRRGLEVSDEEVDAYLDAAGGSGSDASSMSDEQRRQLVRQRLMVQRLHMSIADDLPPATEQELASYIERSRGRFASRERLRLRALRFESAEGAQQAVTRIRNGRMSFAEAVVTYEKDPGQGVLLELTWANLSPDIREALGDLKPGEVSRPVEFNGQTFVFQLDSWVTDSGRPGETEAGRARNELNRQRLGRATDALLNELRESTPVTIGRTRLPFRYVVDSGNPMASEDSHN